MKTTTKLTPKTAELLANKIKAECGALFSGAKAGTQYGKPVIRIGAVIMRTKEEAEDKIMSFKNLVFNND